MFDGQIFEHEGNRFRFKTERDDSMGPPWEEHDGHGLVSDWTTRDKLPGELVLCEDRGSRRYYDFASTLPIARRDGWNAEPYSETETPRQRAAKAVRANFEHLRRWCSDQWEWIGVVIELVDDSDDPTGETASLWGIESDSGDSYLDETAHELADEIISRIEAIAA